MSLLKGKNEQTKTRKLYCFLIFAAQARKRCHLFNRLFKFVEALDACAAVQTTAQQGLTFS